MEDHQQVMKALDSFTNMQSTFYKMRNGHLRFSDGLMAVISKLINKFTPQQSEYLILLHELFHAAIDLQMIHTSDNALKILIKKFPESERIQRLKGILLEANGDDENAGVLYDKLISENLMDQGTRKRKISLQRKQFNNEQAIGGLNIYLTSFPQDIEAWMELADIYLEHLNYTKALFCMEEILLIQPADLHYVIRIAEINYSLANYANAKNYYCYALSKNAEDTRALWGLFQTLRRKKREGNDKELAEVTAKAIQKVYKQKQQEQCISNYPFAKVLTEM